MRKHPGKFIEEYLEKKGIPKEDLASAMDISNALLDKIIDGSQPLLRRHAVKLAFATRTRPFGWMIKQLQYDLENDTTETSTCSVLVKSDNHFHFTRTPKHFRILWVDFGDDGEYQPPEIRKHRPVVILSKVKRNRKLVMVASISTVKPKDFINDNVCIPAAKYKGLHRESWIKLSLINTVSTDRLYHCDSTRDEIVLDEMDQLAVTSILERLLPVNIPAPAIV